MILGLRAITTAVPQRAAVEEYLELARNWPQNYYSPDNRNINIVDPEDFMDPRPPPTGFDAVNSGKDPEPETWSSPMWSRILVVGVSLAVAYRTMSITWRESSPQSTLLLYSFNRSLTSIQIPQVARDFDARSLSLRRQWADDRLIFASKASDPDDRLAPIRISYVDMHTSGSDRLVDVDT
ncbi:hypothetical protein BASA60_003481 [Batrachochytrium salamandrivorans]|nr:hypothetical protein BASA60_003481 [Batrachochytrium salamandrivorans]